MGPLRPVDGLRVAETLALDGRHRLVVVRRGEAELLLAIGPHGVSRIDILPPPATIANAATSVP